MNKQNKVFKVIVTSRNLIPRTLLILFFVFIGIVTMNSAKAQQSIRDKFLVDKISRYETDSNFYVSEYIYDVKNRLSRIISIGKMFEQYQLKNTKYVHVFEYENDRVSKIMYYDSTHFMFDYDTHFQYNSQGQLIRSEEWKNGHMLEHRNYHYEDGLVVSIYDDFSMPFEVDTLYYDDSKNVIKHSFRLPSIRTYHYEYDNGLKPNFGLDYLFAYWLLPGLGTAVPNEIRYLSNNNMTKAIFQQTTYVYTFNEHGLPNSYELIWDNIPTVYPILFTITYKQIELSITEPTQADEINIYPNPTTGELKVESGELRIESVVIYDIFGKIRKIEKSKNTIDISHLSTGIYFVKICTEAGEVVKKVLKE